MLEMNKIRMAISFLINAERVYPLYWVIVAIGVLIIDYITGPEIHFPILFIIPISLASWFNSRAFSLSLSIFIISTNTVYSLMWGGEAVQNIIINLLIRFAVLVVFALLVNKLSEQSRELKREIKVLRGILPICSHCKRIRDKGEEWHQMEEYISSYSEAKFTHSICPDCAERYYADYLNKK